MTLFEQLVSSKQNSWWTHKAILPLAAALVADGEYPAIRAACVAAVAAAYEAAS